MPFLLSAGTAILMMTIEVTGSKCIKLQQLIWDSLRHNFSAMITCFRTNIDQMICSQHNILIMFHYQYTVANITQIFQCIDQSVIIPLVQTN